MVIYAYINIDSKIASILAITLDKKVSIID